MINAGDVQPGELSRAASIILKVASIAALIVLLFGRALGPSDLWDHTQTRTVSYTTDIIVHGGTHWILPIERGEAPATKPPLYNWLAVPMVMWLGFNSEIAHRFPSIAAMCICWLVVVRLGNAIDCQRMRPALGWLAGLAFATNFAMFKLSFLARPDMLLTLWLLLGWITATRILSNESPLAGKVSRWMIFGFWTCVILAVYTKGPAAIVLPVYAAFAARVLRGSWRAVALLRFGWGIGATAIALGIGIYLLWRIDPAHLQSKLIDDEFIGRVVGTGAEGNRHGPQGLLIDLPVQGMYFIARFLPWSIPALSLTWMQLRSRRRLETGPWVHASIVWILVVVGLYTLSAGKRAEYIAGAMPACAILAAWCLLHVWTRIGIRSPWVAPLAGFASLAVFVGYDQLEISAPQRGFGEGIRQFIDRCAERMTSEPMPGGVVCCWAGETQLQAMLGLSQIDGKDVVFSTIDRGKPFWLLAGRKTSEPREFAQWLRPRRPTVLVESVIESLHLPRDEGWPEQVTLYRVTP